MCKEKKYRFYTVSQQVTPLTREDAATPESGPAGVSLKTNCAFWQLRVMGYLPTNFDGPGFGIFVDNAFYPFSSAPADTSVTAINADIVVTSPTAPAPSVQYDRPVSVAYRNPGDTINPLFLPFSNSYIDGLGLFSVVFIRGYFEPL